MHDFIKFLERELGNGGSTKNRLVEKSLPAKPEWIKSMKELDAKRKKALEIADQIEAGSKKLWAQIELGLDDFSTDKRWNESGTEIEILTSKDDKTEKGKPVKSPFQKDSLN